MPSLVCLLSAFLLDAAADAAADEACPERLSGAPDGAVQGSSLIQFQTMRQTGILPLDAAEREAANAQVSTPPPSKVPDGALQKDLSDNLVSFGWQNKLLEVDGGCPAGYTFTQQNVWGRGRRFTHVDAIEKCAKVCTDRPGCTEFEYAFSGNERTKCGTYTGGKVAGRQRAGWRTCVKATTAGPYVPGTPGAPWTAEEAAAVKGALIAMFQETWGISPWKQGVSAGTLLRLSFHDCLKYANGAGGCDGCLNWWGVDVPHFEGPSHQSKVRVLKEGEGANNGLGPAVRALEEIYTKPLSALLPHSLQGTGKSRADLWSLAGIVAVEYTMDINNEVCATGATPRQTIRRSPLGLGQCLYAQDEEQCAARPSRPPIFKTGRRDCVTILSPNYKTERAETHPDNHGNGVKTAQFFKEQFDFSGRETVAIMGAHTIGRYHISATGFKYVWTPRSEWSFNNEYYRNMMLDTDASWVFNNDDCPKIGDAYGVKPHQRWAVKANLITTDGGPIQWVKFSHVGPDCRAGRGETQYWSDSYWQCCNATGIPGAVTRPDSNRPLGSDSLEQDDNEFSGCEKWKILWARDHALLNTDIGLLLHFETDANGFPKGCPGLEGFDSASVRPGGPTKNRTILPLMNGSPRRFAWQDCGKETHAEPPSDRPLHEHVEEFARDQTAWLDAFIPALEKYMESGYLPGELRQVDRSR
eukprot:CAMPEP_0179069454 /NCGR_PEP_ID=MMETSP0796-20121207/30515_1 /TAXON_ID=73915 /ORGANISM="Pyrodinium bahamense, Strain pbaha01" /LENGTH=697 /DNA_ID=CAMNT_0020766519 /DNA_START=50 /DNA_END=2143 /DNA_ORIENTATION=-